MNEFFSILVSLLTQPWSIVLWVAFVSWLVFGVWRYKKLARILNDLENSEPGKRRYKLERRYKIYPGPAGKPVTHVRCLRTRWFLLVAGVCLVMVAALLGVAADQTLRSREAVLAVDVLSVSPLRFGYAWSIRLENKGTGMVEVQSVRLVVSPKGEHPVKDMPRPEYDRAPTGQMVFRVNPRSTEVPVVNVAGEITLGPGIVRSLSFEIEAEHEPHRGWIYEMTPEVKWNLAGSSRTRTETGPVYRLGWPGLPHWSEPGAKGGDNSRAVVDNVRIVSGE